MCLLVLALSVAVHCTDVLFKIQLARDGAQIEFLFDLDLPGLIDRQAAASCSGSGLPLFGKSLSRIDSSFGVRPAAFISMVKQLSPRVFQLDISFNTP